MELCNGGDLYKLLKARESFNEVEARFLLGQIASGLSKINKLNVVHRDLKLDNIFIHFKNLSHEDVFGDPEKL
jgi:serine/threonine protein kinase